MMQSKLRHWVLFASIVAATLLPCNAGRSEPADRSAREILDRAKVQGGLIVHVGCGDGVVTAALGADPSFVVQGLERDADLLERAQSNIRSQGNYGQVSATPWDGRSLPYADNLVNLLVIEDADAVDSGEMLRVLAPQGVALVREGDRWTRQVKPWPKAFDEWPHYLHGPDNNAVAKDTAVGPPQSMQWIGGPRYARSHEINSSLAALVSSGGRLFYIWDEGPTGMTEKAFPPMWSLIARDAFNGVVLWKQPMPDWGWRQWHDASRWDDARERARMLRHLPPTLPRRLVASGDRVYVTLGYEAPVSELDAATGRVLRTFDRTKWTDEILCMDDYLILRVRIPESPPEKDVWDKMTDLQRGRVVAVDRQSGGILWQSPPDTMAPLTLAACAHRVFYADYQQVVCLDLATGEERWRSESAEDGRSGHRATGGTLVANDQVVLYAHASASGVKNFAVRAFAADTGKLLWSGPHYAGPGVANPPDLFIADDLVWLGETNLPVDVFRTVTERQGLDPVSGRVVRQVSVPKLTSPGHHFRCYRSKATERYLLLPKRGVEFLDLVGQNHMRHDWLRAPCIYGVLPANGLLYVAPHQCVCYPGVLLSGFNALAASPPALAAIPPAQQRVKKGPAWGDTVAASEIAKDDWPCYRHDAQRSGVSGTRVPARLQVHWQISLNGAVSPPVVAENRLLVAEKDKHTIHAFSADTGKTLWSFTAGARIDSPPTVHQGLVLFGSADGWVYCLRASDGAEVWRFQAAPSDRRIMVRGQIESAWPVHGSVLVQEDHTASDRRPVVYFTAGRSTYLDTGIYVYGLDPHTGDVVHQTCLSGPRPNPYEDEGGAGYMDGAKSDLLVSDGADLYLFQERFRSDLTRVPSPLLNKSKEYGGYRVYPAFPERGSTAKRLISTGGFLDDSYNEGVFWTYGDRWPGWDRKMSRVPSYGQLLVFDDHRLYGVDIFTDNIRVRRGFSIGQGYRLFARDHEASQDAWSIRVPVAIRAMVLASKRLFVAGAPDRLPPDDPLAAIDGRQGGRLWSVSATDGQNPKSVMELPAPPAFDALIAASGCLFLGTTDGRVMCIGE